MCQARLRVTIVMKVQHTYSTTRSTVLGHQNATRLRRPPSPQPQPRELQPRSPPTRRRQVPLCSVAESPIRLCVSVKCQQSVVTTFTTSRALICATAARVHRGQDTLARVADCALIAPMPTELFGWTQMGLDVTNMCDLNCAISAQRFAG